MQCERFKHEFECAIKLVRWTLVDNNDRIGWRFSIQSICDQSGCDSNIEFIRRDYLRSRERDVSSFVDLWFNRNNDWLNVDRPLFWMHDSPPPRPKLDSITVDRTKLTADNIMEYLNSIRTEQGRIYCIFNDGQLSFQFDIGSFREEDGFDFGAVKQDLFQLTFEVVEVTYSRWFSSFSVVLYCCLSLFLWNNKYIKNLYNATTKTDKSS